MEDVVRKVEGHDVAVAVWSRDPNLGCGGVWGVEVDEL